MDVPILSIQVRKRANKENNGEWQLIIGLRTDYVLFLNNIICIHFKNLL